MGSIWGRQDPGGPNVGPHELSYLGGDHSETNIYSACTRVANGTIRQARVGRRLRERKSKAKNTCITTRNSILERLFQYRPRFHCYCIRAVP